MARVQPASSLAAISLSALLLSPLPATADPPADPGLARQILAMKAEDQRVRNERFPLHANEERYIVAMREVDERNQLVIGTIFKEHGWPSEALVGREAVEAFWLLVQHFPPLLKEALPLMEAAAERGELPKKSLAKSIDRVRMVEGKLQLYGTQYKLIDGDLIPDPIEDPAHLDERRAAMGLPSHAEEWQKMRADFRPARPPAPQN